MDKAEGRRILLRLQACANFKNDLQAAEVLAEVLAIATEELEKLEHAAAEELAQLEPPAAKERAERSGQDRQHKGGRDRAII